MKAAAATTAIQAMGIITPMAILDAVLSPFEEVTTVGDVDVGAAFAEPMPTVDEIAVVEEAREVVAPDEVDIVAAAEASGKEETSPPERGTMAVGRAVSPPPLQLLKPRKSTNF